jgi:hypothetical protein
MALFAKSKAQPAAIREPQIEELGCPAFASLVETLERQPEQKYHVLDLAAASGNHIDFFSRFRCRYHVGDVLLALSELSLPEEGQADPDFEEILPLSQLEKLDLVLAWDGLNYLSRDLLPLFSKHLIRQCKPGTWVHAFIYTRGDMARRPNRFKIVSTSTMTREADMHDAVGAPCYPQRVLEQCMPGFKAVQSRLLKNGLQEYLFQVM